MAIDPPRITDWQPDIKQRSLRQAPIRNVITPGEAFKRGFYGGLGLWCSFMVLNILFLVISAALLASLGIIGAAVQ